jgi:hypothetical protein
VALSFPGCLIAAQQKWLRTTQTPVSSIALARRKSGHKADLALSRILQVRLRLVIVRMSLLLQGWPGICRQCRSVPLPLTPAY